jgi:alpha-beta hydrolase superfamily lysophospholipase
VTSRSEAPIDATFFASGDGLALYSEYVTAERPRGVLVLSHGYGDHCGRYRALARHLAVRGFAVFAFDYRGHGRSQGRLGFCRHFSDYVNDLEAACLAARRAAHGAPVGIIAHSHGSLVALAALIARADGADEGGDQLALAPPILGAVLSSPYLLPAFRVSRLDRALAGLASRILPSLAKPTSLQPEQLSHDHTVIASHRADPLSHHIATARWFTECAAAQESVRRRVDRIDQPTLWLIGTEDTIADQAANRRAFETARGDATLNVYEGFRHELFNEVDSARVFADVAAWLLARFQVRD